MSKSYVNVRITDANGFLLHEMTVPTDSPTPKSIEIKAAIRALANPRAPHPPVEGGENG